MRVQGICTAAVLALWPAVVQATPGDSVRAAWQDCRTLPATVQPHVRYLSLYAVPAAEREQAYAALSFWCNSLSRSSEIVRPAIIQGAAPGVGGPLLVRVNLVDYAWNFATWEKLAGHDPYFHEYLRAYWPGGLWTDRKYYAPSHYRQLGTASWLPALEMSALVTLTRSRTPIVRADWWLSLSARQLSLNNKQVGVGYYDWLGVKSRADFFRLIKLSERDSLEIGREMRAAVLRSGVAQQNRQIVRLQSLTGGAWTTLDTDDSTGKGNAIANLKRGEFRHQAEEHFGVLPNGMPAYLLCDNQGALQPSAPDFVGPDDSPLRTGRDGRIHVGLSCVRCHGPSGFLQPIDDWARRTLRTPLGLQSADYRELVELRRQYFSDLNRQLVRDRTSYEEAVLDACGLKPPDLARAFARTYDRYAEADVTLDQAAVELGVTAAVLVQCLKGYAKQYGSVPPELAGFLQQPAVGVGVRREQWELVYPTCQEILRSQR